MKIPVLFSVCFVLLVVCQSVNAQGRLPRSALLARPLNGSYYGGSKFTKGQSVLQKTGSPQKSLILPKAHLTQKSYFPQKSHAAAQRYVVQKGHAIGKSCDQCCLGACGGSLYLPGLSCAFERIDAMLNRVLVCHKFGMTKCASSCDSKCSTNNCGCSIKSSCGCGVQKAPPTTSTPYYAPPLLPDEQVDPFEDDDVRAPLPPPLLDHSVQKTKTQQKEQSVASAGKHIDGPSVTSRSPSANANSDLRFKEVKLINHETPVR